MIRLHEENRKLSLPTLCSLFGYSRQAYYQSCKSSFQQESKEGIILQIVDEIRSQMPCIGARKLHYMLKTRLPDELQIGRDALFNLLRVSGYLQRKRYYRPSTTDSHHRMHTYKNLIKEFIPSGSNQLYVADITYIRLINNEFYYLSLITDAYSHKIVGWCLLDSLDTTGPIIALQMALKELPMGSTLIHHSDRGTQYCCGKYIKLLKGLQISMTENGNPRENAIAERVNGILKSEWLDNIKIKTLPQGRRVLSRIISLYNNSRPHSSIGMLTPSEAHKRRGKLERLWKNYYKRKEVRRDNIQVNM